MRDKQILSHKFIIPDAPFQGHLGWHFERILFCFPDCPKCIELAQGQIGAHTYQIQKLKGKKLRIRRYHATTSTKQISNPAAFTQNTYGSLFRRRFNPEQGEVQPEVHLHVESFLQSLLQRAKILRLMIFPTKYISKKIRLNSTKPHRTQTSTDL